MIDVKRYSQAISKCVLVAFVFTLLSGCADYREINELSFVLGIALDKGENSPYKATLQVVNPSNVSTATSSSGGPSIINFEGEGKTPGEAIWHSFKKTSRYVSFPHLEVLVISEELAKEGILNILEVFERDFQLRLSTTVLLSHNTSAASILKVLTPLNKITSEALVTNVENIQKVVGTNSRLTISKVIQYTKNAEEDITISTVTLKRKSKKMSEVANIERTDPIKPEIDGTAFFKEDRWVGWKGGQSTRALVIAYNEGEVMYITAPFNEDEFITLRLLDMKSKRYAKIKNGKAQLTMDVKGNATISEIIGPYELANNEDLKPLEKVIEKKLEEEIQQMFKFSQKLGVDSFGYGEQLAIQHPAQWSKFKDSWRSIYKNAETNVRVDISIKTEGARKNSIKFYERGSGHDN